MEKQRKLEPGYAVSRKLTVYSGSHQAWLAMTESFNNGPAEILEAALMPENMRSRNRRVRGRTHDGAGGQ